MKKLLLPLFSAALLFASCSDDDSNDNGNNGDTGNNTVSVTGMITENRTWSSDSVYVLNQKVVVDAGATLTIEAGTIIKGSTGSGSLASALIVARGGKINAVGTADAPIIFTSTSDNIEAGQTVGTNLDENARGLWGGLIILGNAPCSLKSNVTETQIEGIPADDSFGAYGGDLATDNSGVLKYVSIRHGGALIGEGNEINGLTLGGVGNGTVIENVEVVANVDDGIEFFGGTVNAKNLLVWAQGDDGLDIDQAYSGTIDNAMVILGAASDHALEIDGPEGAAEGSFTLKNITLVGNTDTSKGEYADYRSKAMGTTSSVYAYGFKESSDVELDNNGVAQNFLDSKLSFADWDINGADNTIFAEKVAKDDNDVEIEDKIILNPSFTERAAEWTTKVDSKGANGADNSAFAWTFANAKAAF